MGDFKLRKAEMNSSKAWQVSKSGRWGEIIYDDNRAKSVGIRPEFPREFAACRYGN